MKKCHQTFISVSKKRKRNKIKNSNKNYQIDTNKQTKLRVTFDKYATTLHDEVLKSIQRAEKYCALVPKLKRYLFDKTLARSLSNYKKGSPECGLWKEKRIVTLMSNLAFDFTDYV